MRFPLINIERTVVITFLTIAFFLFIDIADDLAHGAHLTHVLLEGIGLSISTVMFIWLYRNETKEVSYQLQTASQNLSQVMADRDVWRTKALQFLDGLGRVIDEQFEKWHLSESEKDIGLLILKGLSHKEIADIRATSERTVRQQATSIYAKAGLENKNQLAAFFLEDLILPGNSKTDVKL